MYNSSADISPTGSQLPRLVGLAYASRLYRESPELQSFSQFSRGGNEIAFGTVGNATTAEGMFWEAINAIGVLKAPVLLSIWDDEYGISVPNVFQMVKQNLSELLKGFQRENGSDQGFDLYQVRGWDYPALVDAYLKAASIVRRDHIPAIIHVTELTQPQGHSTSGSHERYKSKDRLEWEEQSDCQRKFRDWIIEQDMATPDELDQIQSEAQKQVEAARKQAWNAYLTPIHKERQEASLLIEGLAIKSSQQEKISLIKNELKSLPNPFRRDIFGAIREALMAGKDAIGPEKKAVIDWKIKYESLNAERYDSHLYSQSPNSALDIAEIRPVYADDSPTVYGFDVMNACFDAALGRDPRVIAFGEDVGNLGDVNQGFHGLQAKYGKLRVSDTGIRELTILGQAIGMAMRGLRPIAEIQYLDYLLYALQIMSDDLATLHWRTRGGQKAPVIIRTRGHRLEGIWHSGSPMAGIIHLVRGILVLVPRNMTQAAGFFNTLLLADDPALVVEVLNGYRVKERVPKNIGEMTIPVGVPEIIREGKDITLVTYGACCRIVMEAARLLAETGIEAEVIDVRSLLPFDIHGLILDSLKKTSRIVIIDEDVPGGATSYILQQVIERQGGYGWLDSPPRTITGKSHRPAYGSDGDYFSKPNVEQVFESVYDMMHEVDPASYPLFFK